MGHFDLVVIDEAHRSVYRKYRGIFEYFDSLLVGLTATPKDEVDKNTYDLFDLETGVPTDVYSLDDAIKDGFLVPPRGVSVELKFVREGIKYDELKEEDKDTWDEMDWGTDDEGDPLDPPEAVDPAELNKWLFNKDTVDRVLEYLMTEGVKVAGGDRLGKTIIFAKNQKHAEFIKERFDANYPSLDAGNFARVITHQVKYGQSLIDDFSNKTKAPHIAISVDMLDTGIDVPESRQSGVSSRWFGRRPSSGRCWAVGPGCVRTCSGPASTRRTSTCSTSAGISSTSASRWCQRRSRAASRSARSCSRPGWSCCRRSMRWRHSATSGLRSRPRCTRPWSR